MNFLICLINLNYSFNKILSFSGCSFLQYYGTNLLCFLMQFLIIPIVLIILIFSIPFLNVQAFNPAGKIKFYF